jgi:uncharacterized Ntn-hydrolase superfamily protein
MLSHHDLPCISTYSIVAADPPAGEVGIAVQSKFLAVGHVVPWAKGGVGAVATQAWANLRYGPEGLAFLEQGMHPEEIAEVLIKDDSKRDSRQFGIVDLEGRSATYTGAACAAWAGGIAGKNFAAQGNILVSRDTVDALAETFQKTEGDLTTRLMEALAAGQEAGGDRRGMQSAALYVVKKDGGYGGGSDRLVDIRVDDHKEPIKELRRLLGLWRFYLQKTTDGNLQRIEGDIKTLILTVLQKKGLYRGPLDAEWNDELQDFFTEFSLTENFDERLAPFGQIDREVVSFLKEHY